MVGGEADGDVDDEHAVLATIDPAKLYCIAEHKVDIAEQVKKAGGKKLKKEAHGGARRRTEAAIEASRAK